MGGVNYFIKIPHKFEHLVEEKFQKAMNNSKNDHRNSAKQQKSNEIDHSCQTKPTEASP